MILKIFQFCFCLALGLILLFWWLCSSKSSTEKHLWKITKQIILVIKNEVLVFVKTNYFKCLHFSRSQIKFYQIFQTYSGTITNRWEKFKTMVISPNTYLFFQKNGKSMEKLPFFKKSNHFLLEWQPFFNIRWPYFNEKQPFFNEKQLFFIWVCFNTKYQIQIFSNTLKTTIYKSINTKYSGSLNSTNPNITK